MTDPLDQYRRQAEAQEKKTLHSKAAFSCNHQRYYGAEDDHRLPYKRDVDRILHSRAYARYIDKTQVVYLVDNDHIAHRGLHVQLVSSFAKGLGDILRLNIDLIEAISLGHDVGHPPFGHEGEGYLSELSQEYDNGPFMHPKQSCRLFREIEPLNLGLATYDGFLCHDGETIATQYIPHFNKSWDDHFREFQEKLPERNLRPGTLEGCLVKLCDTVSYLGRDIEDAINLGILSRQEIPQTILGTSNREILNNLAIDIIKMSIHKDHIAISEEVCEALKALRFFNFENIYVHPKLKSEAKKIKNAYRTLFETLLNDLEKHNKDSYLWKHFNIGRSQEYLSSTSHVQMVVDYIAGMTDNYFIKTLKKLIIPTPIEID